MKMVMAIRCYTARQRLIALTLLPLPWQVLLSACLLASDTTKQFVILYQSFQTLGC